MNNFKTQGFQRPNHLALVSDEHSVLGGMHDCIWRDLGRRGFKQRRRQRSRMSLGLCPRECCARVKCGQ